MTELSSGVVRESARFLRDVYVPRLRRALEVLPASDLWWRPHAGVLSIGVVLTHLEGNVRQWILSGIGELADIRDRAAEFRATHGADRETLLARLVETVAEACRLIEALDETRLVARYTIQGDEVTGLYAVHHVVEHFAWHSGQAVWIAKARAGVDHGVAFYDDAEVDRAQNG